MGRQVNGPGVVADVIGHGDRDGKVAGLIVGVAVVELAAIGDPGLIPQTTATVLGIAEQPRRPLVEVLVESLRSHGLLLVIDNCEHLLAACAELADQLLRNCPHVTILATSREPLGVAQPGGSREF